MHDVNGWLRETKDATGYAITLGYDAAGGHVSTTDSQGNPLWSGTVQYGIAPFTTEATDADLGAWRYTYDALGEVTNWTDAKGQSFSAKYDALSRMTDRYEPDLYSHWTWGSSAAAHNIGQLQSACTGTGANPTACTTSGYAESETYDAVVRPSQRSVTIPGDKTYTYTRTYNAEGLPDTMTYPVSTAGYALAIKFGYAYGLLDSITDTSDSPNVKLWTADAMNARGQYTQETFGNGVVVNHAFDPYRGLLQSITAGAGGGTALQNNSYLYDPVGNLTQRQDNNAGTTESVYYDSLNRLSYTVGDSNTKMSYDAMGRIASWEAYGNTANVQNYDTQQSGCTYYANAQPHAVRESTQAPGGSSFCYDANGNMTEELTSSGAVRSFTWMSFNQPSAISVPSYNGSSAFYYDENHQRFEQIASYSGSAEDTEYIGGLMEKMTNSTGTAYRYYVPAGNNFIVYNRWLSGTNAIDYATKDNINSTAVITGSNGALVVAEKYAALGWNEGGNGATIATVTRHEFTGQEGLNNNGLWLVDMNGRIYNSSGAYFYSPDPNIPDPQNTLDYNRYAYVDHNPLTFWDPTGFCGVTQNDDGSISVDICAPPIIPDICVACFTSFPGDWPGVPYKRPYYPSAPPQPQPPQSTPTQTLNEVTVKATRVTDETGSFTGWLAGQLQASWVSSFGMRDILSALASALPNLPPQQSTWQKIRNWLCSSGNGLASTANKLSAAGLRIEGLGAALTGMGLIGQPEVNPAADALVGSGVATMLTGAGAGTLATVMQIGGGIAQMIGSGDSSVGANNTLAGSVSLLAGGLTGWVTGGSSETTQAYVATMADTGTSMVPGMSSGQAQCGTD